VVIEDPGKLQHHGVESTGLLSHTTHLHNHRCKHPGLGQRDRHTLTRFHSGRQCTQRTREHHVVYGLDLLAFYQAQEVRGRQTNPHAVGDQCQEPGDARELTDMCALTFIQAKYMDPLIWRFDNTQERFMFLGQQHSLFLGYQREVGYRPFGVQPLSRGQEFLIHYEERFQNMGVDI